MEFRQFGRTGEKVSAVSFGTMGIGGNEFGNCYGSTDDKTSLRAIDAAVDLGCNLFDTADLFGMGKSETLLGQALLGKRKNVMIAGKVGIDIHKAGVFPSYSESHFRNSIEKSLGRLNTDYLDIVHLLNPPVSMLENDAVFEPLRRMKEEGKIRFIGLSAHLPEEALLALEFDFLDSLMIRFHLAEREAAEAIGCAVQKERGVVMREPLFGGLLTGRYEKDHLFEPGDIRSSVGYDRFRKVVSIGKQVRQLADSAGWSPAALLIRWVLERTEATTVTVGIKTAEQAEKNLKAGAAEMPDETVLCALDEMVPGIVFGDR